MTNLVYYVENNSAEKRYPNSTIFIMLQGKWLFTVLHFSLSDILLQG